MSADRTTILQEIYKMNREFKEEIQGLKTEMHERFDKVEEKIENTREQPTPYSERIEEHIDQ